VENKENSKIKSREVSGGRVIIVYEDGLVTSVDKKKYYDSLSKREKKEFILERL